MGALSRLTNVQTIKTAVGCEKGTATLSLPDGFEGNAAAYAISQNSRGRDCVEVTVDSLDAILSTYIRNHAERIALIKIDVEGYEEHVLQGSQQILEVHRPHLVVEIHSVEQFLATTLNSF